MNNICHYVCTYSAVKMAMIEKNLTEVSELMRSNEIEIGLFTNMLL